MRYKEENLYCEGNATLEQVTQRSVQGQAGQDFEQAVEGVRNSGALKPDDL